MHHPPPGRRPKRGPGNRRLFPQASLGQGLARPPRRRHARWQHLADVRRVFPHADAVRVGSGNTVTVFNLAGNSFRLITAIHYQTQLVFVLRLLTHAEYSKNRWKLEL
ncbi:MAG: type II toxin-antitoxin system HigB family toxin [Prosthecobacter sp.]|nr:type II toxin-antitoxin system HigB family toxin [Prosthecobacter sp.]